jgi:hypothetical protein
VIVLRETTSKNIRFSTEFTGTHHGQSDFTTLAYVDGQIAGYLNFSEFDNTLYVNMIEVRPEMRHNSIAFALMRNLQQQYPDTPIQWGLMTDDGSSLKKAITYNIPNEHYNDLVREKEQIEIKLREYEEAPNNDADYWNDLWTGTTK